MNDFKGEDYDFAAGSIHGMRSWSMDDLGRLHGVTHKDVWRPGENVAVCKATKWVPCPNRAALDKRPAPRPSRLSHDRAEMFIYDEFRLYQGGSCNEPDCRDWTHAAPTDHAFDPDCECGFWAYDEHTFAAHGDVMGIISGYGKTTIGTRGFRCEKATIAALCREHNDKLISLSRWLRLQQLYPDVKFYDDEDEMVAKHGAVLHNWAEVGDDFWDKPVKSGESESMWATLSQSYIKAIAPRMWMTNP